MRLKSAIWVAAYVRRCHVEGAFAAVRRRGAEEAGAIFIKLNRLDGTAELFGPAPQSAFDEAHPTERAFAPQLRRAARAGGKVEERLVREIRFDPDAWIVEVEDRAGPAFPRHRHRVTRMTIRRRGRDALRGAAARWREISDSARRAFSTA